MMLTGADLLAKVKELGDVSKSDLVRSCGYVSSKKDGTERLNFTAFYEALLEAIAAGFCEAVGHVPWRRRWPWRHGSPGPSAQLCHQGAVQRQLARRQGLHHPSWAWSLAMSSRSNWAASRSSASPWALPKKSEDLPVLSG